MYSKSNPVCIGCLYGLGCIHEKIIIDIFEILTHGLSVIQWCILGIITSAKGNPLIV